VSADQRAALGALTVGDTVIVLPTGMGERHSNERPTRATVVKRGRVWIDVEPEDGERHLAYFDRRFRLDTQHNGSQNSTSRGRFVTEAQYAWDLRLRTVKDYLRQAGITVEDRVRGELPGDASTPGPWYGRWLELANLLRAHEGLEPL